MCTTNLFFSESKVIGLIRVIESNASIGEGGPKKGIPKLLHFNTQMQISFAEWEKQKERLRKGVQGRPLTQSWGFRWGGLSRSDPGQSVAEAEPRHHVQGQRPDAAPKERFWVCASRTEP